MLRRPELPVSSGSLKLAQHIFIQVPLHILIFQIIGIQIFHTRNNLLQHLRRRNEKGRICHKLGKGSIRRILIALPVCNGYHFAAAVEIGKLPILHAFNGRKYESADDMENFIGILILKIAPAHSLSHGRGRKYMRNLHSCQNLHLLISGFLHIQGTDKHQIGKLFDNRQWIRNTTGPNISPNLVYLIFDCACNHINLHKAILFLLLYKFHKKIAIDMPNQHIDSLSLSHHAKNRKAYQGESPDKFNQ